MVPLIATVLLALLASEQAVASGRWRRPLPGGAIARPFTYERSAPFAGGRRRGIDVSGSPGARVGAVCGGVVAYAGRVPRWGRGVTLRCADGLVATELGLASSTVGRGARVLPGATLGHLAAVGVLRVGARRPGDRFGYVDPARLFGEDEAPPGVAPPASPSRRARRTRRPAPAARPVVVPRAGATPAPARPPLPILAGAGLLALAAGGGVVGQRRVRRRPAPEWAAVQR
ncbi:MAG TPA: M23 family metallopeptidase [Baekduia sp.]|uniref:M23 family metallopeptidase n=1 Tax=Baekduia sp. TaxID=2600305 RepID=UPI002D776751|nr:M23 family metallopeptidase [Baekduia sp.]HET6505260.1 M23 family metallopeptidase [Baekduia sp.]